jgi:hypothetical protein
MFEPSRSCLVEGLENGPQIIGSRHHSEGADVGSACVADGVSTGPRAWCGDRESHDLPDDLAASACAEAEGEHGEVGTHMPTGKRLAEDVGALEMCPGSANVTSISRTSCERHLAGPCFDQLCFSCHVDESAITH